MAASQWKQWGEKGGVRAGGERRYSQERRSSVSEGCLSTVQADWCSPEVTERVLTEGPLQWLTQQLSTRKGNEQNPNQDLNCSLMLTLWWFPPPWKADLSWVFHMGQFAVLSRSCSLQSWALFPLPRSRCFPLESWISLASTCRHSSLWSPASTAVLRKKERFELSTVWSAEPVGLHCIIVLV